MTGLLPWPCSGHFLGPWHVDRGQIQPSLMSTLDVQVFIADIMGVMSMASTQQTFVKNKTLNKKTEPHQQCRIATGPCFRLCRHALPKWKLLGRGRATSISLVSLDPHDNPVR